MTTTDEDWENHLQLKLLGYVRMVREVVPHMKAVGGGRIVNVAGMTAHEPDVHFLLPGVLNAALLNFTKALSKEFEADCIFVNAVNPASVETSLLRDDIATLAQNAGKSVDKMRQWFSDLSSQGRIATGEDVAKVVVFLASDAAGQTTGVC